MKLKFHHATPSARQEIAGFIIQRAQTIASWRKILSSPRDKEKNAAVVTELLHLARQIEIGEL